MKSRLKTIGLYTLLALSSLIVYLPVMYHASRLRTDFGLHINIALQMPEKLEAATAPLYHGVFLAAHRFAGLAPQNAALAAVLLVMIPVPMIAFALFRRRAGKSVPDWVLMAAALGLSIMSPIMIWKSHYMVGYIHAIVFHNPTSITVRLFVIPVSILAFRAFDIRPFRSLNHRVYILLLSAVLVTLMMLAKPSFALALLPGCCVFAIWRCLRRRHVDWIHLILGIMIPATFMLGLLALLSYVAHDDGTGFAIGFLTVLTQHVPAWRIPIKLLLSIVFPIGASLLYARQAIRDPFFAFAWLIFVCAILLAYFLHETGPRLSHGNFLWTSYSAVFLLMFASALFLIDQYIRELQHGESRLRIFGLNFSGRFAVASLLFVLQVIAGISYYHRYLTTF